MHKETRDYLGQTMINNLGDESVWFTGDSSYNNPDVHPEGKALVATRLIDPDVLDREWGYFKQANSEVPEWELLGSAMRMRIFTALYLQGLLWNKQNGKPINLAYKVPEKFSVGGMVKKLLGL